MLAFVCFGLLNGDAICFCNGGVFVFFGLFLNDDEDDVELEMHQGAKDEKWR